MKLKELINLIKNSSKQSVSMRKRLLLYMMLLFIIAVAILMTELVFLGVISIDNERIVESMNMRLDTEEDQIQEEIDAITVQGISMAEGLGRETEHILTDNNIEKEDLNNNLDALYELQNASFGYMDTAVQVSSASGVYVIFDATANTKVENANDSRSGVYLRVSNIDLKEKANKELNLYRGIAEIGREKGLRMNNQWQLEFDMNRVDINIPEEKIKDISTQYVYSEKKKLVNMWEEVVLLSVPFTSTDGTVYGICGLELSEALFSLWHPAFNSDYGPFVTVLAPCDGKTLYLEKGLLGGTKNTFLTDNENFNITHDGNVTKFESSYGKYVGIIRDTDIISGKDDMKYVIAILTPEASYDKLLRSIQLRWIITLLVVIIVCFILSIILSRRYVKPVLSGMEAIMSKEGDTEKPGKTGYSEIDELIEFMKSRSEDEKIVEEKLPDNIAVLFDKFIENSKKLSPAEWVVMDLYIEGHDISEIPDLAFISMATVRKHNRNIYEKMEVASRDELMLYLDLFRRIDRLDELAQCKKDIDNKEKQ